MTDDHPLLNKQQRKKQRRRVQKERERGAHLDLGALTSSAIEQALRAAAELTDGSQPGVRSKTLDLALPASSEALFIRKRLNDALKVDEWLDEVHVALIDKADGVEIRIEVRR